MIKRVRVRNFLSLKDVDLELGVRNLLVGPNMSGKSNLISCGRFQRRDPGVFSLGDHPDRSEATRAFLH